MEKKAFLNCCAKKFKENGFIRKGQSFYYHHNAEIMAVFSFMKSVYGPYFYMEYGFVFYDINKHLPYPKYNELDINCGRIVTANGKSIYYEEISSELMNEFFDDIQKYVNNVLLVLSGGIDSVAYKCILDDNAIASYVLQGTPEYLGISQDTFRSHQIAIVNY